MIKNSIGPSSTLFRTAFITLFLILTFQTLPAQERLLEEDRVLLLKGDNIPASDFRQYITSFASFGFHIRLVNLSEFRNIKLNSTEVLIIPEKTAGSLDKKQEIKILNACRDGLNIITESASDMAEMLGVKFGEKSLKVNSIRDTAHPEVNIKWKESAYCRQFGGEGLSTFCSDKVTGAPVAIGGILGKGRFIYLGVPLDIPGGFGYGRYPYLHEHFLGFFNYKPLLRRDRLVVYADWGYHDGNDPAELARRLKTYGVNEVHLSGWYSVERCGDFNEKFIRECHANGILVYLWLELPMVSEEFWNMHPEWREKKATGEDAALDWRKLMALENPACFKAVTEYLSTVITGFDWDGVDIAELYFESLVGHTYPEAFTPMSEYVRSEFKGKYGLDPIKIFDPKSPNYFRRDKKSIRKFLDYRVGLCTKLNRQVLEFVQSAGKAMGLDIYLTQIDNPLNDNVKDAIGVDTDEFVKLQKQFRFTMQAEDPYPLWVLGPDRYEKIGKYYRKMLGKEAVLTLDINVVDEGRENPFPTPVQTGLEFLELIAEAQMHSDRVCIYAVNTPYEYDFLKAPYALGTGINFLKKDADTYLSEASKMFIFESEVSWPEVRLNGKEWPCVCEKSVLLPQGRNEIRIGRSQNNRDMMFVTGMSGEIGDCTRMDGSIVLSYNENRNVLISLNKKPSAVYLNGEAKELPVYYNAVSGYYTFRCPGGENKVAFME